MEFPAAIRAPMSRDHARMAICGDDEDQDRLPAVLRGVTKRFSRQLHTEGLTGDHRSLPWGTVHGNVSQGLGLLSGIYIPFRS
jgi:hypothetical protein